MGLPAHHCIVRSIVFKQGIISTICSLPLRVRFLVCHRPLLYAVALLLILWAVLFVAVKRQDPHLEVRNFTQSTMNGTEGAKIAPVTAHPVKRDGEFPRQWGKLSSVLEGDEQRSARDTADAPAHAPVGTFIPLEVKNFARTS